MKFFNIPVSKMTKISCKVQEKISCKDILSTFVSHNTVCCSRATQVELGQRLQSGRQLEMSQQIFPLHTFRNGSEPWLANPGLIRVNDSTRYTTGMNRDDWLHPMLPLNKHHGSVPVHDRKSTTSRFIFSNYVA